MSELGQFSTTLLTWARVLHICKVDGWAQDFFPCNFGHCTNSVLAPYMRNQWVTQQASCFSQQRSYITVGKFTTIC